MIRITGLKVNIGYSDEDIRKAVIKKLGVPDSELKEITVLKKSLDARDKLNIRFVLSVDVFSKDEKKILGKHKKDSSVFPVTVKKYEPPAAGTQLMEDRPCVVGSGPAGIFCAYLLARNGYRPILFERGPSVEKRAEQVKKFWETGVLDPSANVQFGEGGAGTFSDGKLATGVNDPHGLNRFVLETFARFGAPESILTDAKPHVGTDSLQKVVRGIREEIEALGGTVLFNTKLSGLVIEQDTLQAVKVVSEGTEEEYKCSNLVLAIGHSARDTFKMLYESGLKMEPKAFAVGVRVEHLQENINRSQYGDDYKKRYGGKLPPADYKLTYKAQSGRSVYSFCMCPGGYVVNSSSEEGRLCINGMSYSGRNADNANSAIVVSVSPEDFPSDSPLSGVEFQKMLEGRAFAAAAGAIPSENMGSFLGTGRDTDSVIASCKKGIEGTAKISDVLPDFICSDLKEAFARFGKIIRGFDDPGALVSAVESRTSSPVRIVRNECFESNVKGIYPCGEGAGYAGGIMSAAMDGIKVFEEISKRYKPFMV